MRSLGIVKYTFEVSCLGYDKLKKNERMIGGSLDDTHYTF